jgi:AraC-like DNA-binding protein
MVTIIQRYSPPPPAVTPVQAGHQFAVESVISQMRANPGHAFTLDTFAEMANYSPFHFSRMFRNVVGVPPGEFLAALRFEEAKRLILSTEASITDICFEVGFSSLGTFSARFKQLVGRSPAELRNLPESLSYRLPDLEPCFATNLRNMQPPPGATVTGSVLSTMPRKGHLFIGLFPTAIPQSSPVAGTLTRGPGPFRINGVPSGTYRLLAAQFPYGDDPFIHLLPGKSLLVGADPRPVVVDTRNAPRPARIELRLPRLIDPPILSALAPALLNL